MSSHVSTAAITEWPTMLEGLSSKVSTRKKLSAVWEYKTSPLFSDAERIAFDLAIAAASQPNDVTDEMFERAKQHWSEGQIVEIVALVSYFGFMNRFNDTMATPLEEEPIAVAEKHIAQHGWKLGKHGP